MYICKVVFAFTLSYIDVVTHFCSLKKDVHVQRLYWFHVLIAALISLSLYRRKEICTWYSF